MTQVLWWTEIVGRMFPYLQQAFTSSGQQWSAFLPPQGTRDHYPTIRPLRFRLQLKWLPIPEWFYSTSRLYHRHCDGLRELTACSHTYNETSPDLVTNDLPSFHLKGSLSPYYQTPQVLTWAEMLANSWVVHLLVVQVRLSVFNFYLVECK